jgi:hypothetical protein
LYRGSRPDDSGKVEESMTKHGRNQAAAPAPKLAGDRARPAASADAGAYTATNSRIAKPIARSILTEDPRSLRHHIRGAL